mmetsp:Transcript_75492/g.213556  ORF Transcript_75492/g.213556 Transcript_75492/m.213556 type:complete len:471 (+) Transcript_75492:73-1485(+)
MPSNSGDAGFLPQVPKGRPTGRPTKARALDMDESLSITQQMQEQVERLKQKQMLAANKMKESKSAVAKLNDSVGSAQGQLQKTQTEKDDIERSTTDSKAKWEKLQTEHAVLNATHTWTKSSLDSALAAQEEYRKGYNNLRTAFKKAKEDLTQKEADLEKCKNADVEYARLKTDLEEKEQHYAEELKDTQDTLRRFICRQKDKSKAVLDRMIRGEGSGLLTITVQSWRTVVQQEKGRDYSRKELEAAQEHLKAYQAKKKEEARSVLDRMSAASEGGLLALILQNWAKAVQDVKATQAEADKLQDMLKNQKLEARKTLERNLGSSMGGVLTVALKNWVSYFQDMKKENKMRDEAKAALEQFQKRKKGESLSVVGRMAGQKSGALLAQMFICWHLSIKAEVRFKEQEGGMLKKYNTLVAEYTALQEKLHDVVDDLEDTQEELDESRKKNAALKMQFKEIMVLQDSMDCTMKEM